MRAVAMEKMLREIVNHEDEDLDTTNFNQSLKFWENRRIDLISKAKILLDRNDDRSASVIKEVLNERL